MNMTGQFRIALLPGVDETAFEAHMTQDVFGTSALQLTRITSSFEHLLLRGEMRQYVWQATVHLVTDHPYDFVENSERVQGYVADYGLLIGVSVFTNVD